MKKILAGLATGLLLVGTVGIAQAMLINTGTVYYDGADRKLIYDDDLDITWLDYTNGGTNWSSQVSWVDSLSFDVDGVLHDEWRLPSVGASPGDGYNQTSSEMGHLFYNELNLDAGSTTTAELNSSEFDNLIASWYWSGAEGADGGSWSFDTGGGYQRYKSKNYNDYGIAVINGQVSLALADPVPEPATILLFGTGLAGLVGSRLRRKKKA